VADSGTHGPRDESSAALLRKIEFIYRNEASQIRLPDLTSGDNQRDDVFLLSRTVAGAHEPRHVVALRSLRSPLRSTPTPEMRARVIALQTVPFDEVPTDHDRLERPIEGE